MTGSKYVYYHFSDDKSELTREYAFTGGLKGAVGAVVLMDREFDNFQTYRTNPEERIQAKRELRVDVATGSVDFTPIENVEPDNVEDSGTMDFRIRMIYSYLNENYSRMPIKGDSFLVRLKLLNDKLTIQAYRSKGDGRTSTEELVNTMIEMIRSRVGL